MTASHFPTAPKTADAVAAALRENNIALVDRLVTGVLGRVINAPGDIPAGVLDAPDTTGDERYDTLLAVGLAYALHTRGRTPVPWMDAIPPLQRE